MAAAALVMQRLTGAEHGLLVLQAHAAPAFLACAAQEPAQGLVERARGLALQHATSTEQAAIDLVWLTDPARETEAQAQFPSALLLAFHPQAESLQIASTGAYPEDFVQALLRTIHQVSRVIQAHPAERVDQIDLLGDAHRAALLALNPPSRPAPAAPSVHAEFAHTLAAQPNAPAVRWNGGQWSYAQLGAKAAAVASGLQAHGVAAGDVVALALDRSPNSIACVLGVLMVGAAYLPIDPKFPAERVAFMLRDAGARLALTQPDTVALFAPPLQTLDAHALVNHVHSADAQTHAKPADCTPESTAYVMYTSGSTGEPKGIAIPHRAILRLVCGASFMELNAQTVMLHAAPLGFDASTLELWGPLLNGGCCALHEERIPTGPGIARSIAGLGVNSAWLTAALFNAIVDDDPHWFHGLAQLLTGGEALSVAHVRRALDALPHTALINGYGPTECTTFTATYRIPHPLPDDTLSIPIGQPIQDTHVLICSASGELLPRGMVGELCAGGRGVANGYLNRPDLRAPTVGEPTCPPRESRKLGTALRFLERAQRFIADPLNPQGKLYGTGDLVRWRPDGMLEFVGRVGLRRGRPPKCRARPAARRLCGASGGCKLRSGGLAAGAGQRRLHHLPTRQRLSLPGRRAALATLDQPHETDPHTKSHR